MQGPPSSTGPLDMLNPVKLHVNSLYVEPVQTFSNLFIMKHLRFASGQFASYWNVSLLDAAYAHTGMSSNKTYLVTDESSFMSERRKQEEHHFLDQSVFIFGVKIYKLVRWCNIAYNILRSYLYSYWKDNILSDKMLFHCISLLVLVFVTTSQGYYQEMGRRASSVGE